MNILKEVIEDLHITKLFIYWLIICCGLVWIYLESTFQYSLYLSTFAVIKYAVWMKSIALLFMMVSLVLYAYIYIKGQWKQSVKSTIRQVFNLSWLVFMFILLGLPQACGNDWEWVLVLAVYARDYIVTTGERIIRQDIQ